MTIGRSGLTIVVLFSIALCCSCCGGIFGAGGSEEKCISLTGGTFVCCTHFCWLVVGSIIITSANKMKENAEANFDIALQFEVINKCADPRAHIDIEELQ